MHPAGTEAPTEHTRHRFLLLDAMRGLAAIAVALYHAHDLLGHQIVPHGYLAVDFFFFLSGFVIQYAYGPDLDRGMRFATFMKLRIARLYPFYLLTLLPGIALLLGPQLPYGWNPYKRVLVEAAVAGLFVLPFKSVLLAAFPFNPAAWSLCQEFLANILHAIALRGRSLRTLLLLCIPLAAADIAVALHRNTFDYGWAGLDPLLLPFRAFFPYIAGMAIQKWWSSRQHLKVPATPCALALVALLLLPQAPRFPLFLDATIVVIAFPLLIFFAASAATGNTLRRPATLLGLLSYPLYLLHRPLLMVFENVFHISNSPPFTALYIALAILLALALEFLYDRPIRKYLRHRL